MNRISIVLLSGLLASGAWKARGNRKTCVLASAFGGGYRELPLKG